MKKKMEARKGITVKWTQTEPSVKLRSIRYVKYPNSDVTILQVGVQMKSKQV